MTRGEACGIVTSFVFVWLAAFNILSLLKRLSCSGYRPNILRTIFQAIWGLGVSRIVSKSEYWNFRLVFKFKKEKKK